MRGSDQSIAPPDSYKTFDLRIRNARNEQKGGLAPTNTVPEAAFEVVSSALQARILCDRHEDDDYVN